MNTRKFGILILLFLLAWSFNYPQTKTLIHDGTTRTYKVHLPPSYNTSNKLPLILVFNPWTLSPDQTESVTKMSIKADTCNFIVVYPAGIIGSNKEWNHDDRNKTVDDVGFIKELLDTLIKDYSIDTNKVYAAGFSNGAGMAYRMGYELPYRIAAIAPVAGTLIGTNYNPKRATPTIHFVAKNDGSNLANAKSLVEYWKTLNKNVTSPDTFFVTNGANGIKWKGDGNTEFILYTTDAGGHSWPGGNPSFGNNPSKAISANNLLWDFFQAHPLDNSTTDVKKKDNVKYELNYELYQNYPNPFNPETVISYRLSAFSKVNLIVYDILGREITTLVNKQQNSGYYSVKFNASNLTSGIYYYKLKVDDNYSFKKMMVLK